MLQSVMYSIFFDTPEPASNEAVILRCREVFPEELTNSPYADRDLTPLEYAQGKNSNGWISLDGISFPVSAPKNMALKW
jgi:hypothetical protein